MTIAILFAHRKSAYKQLPGLDVWDEDRDARLYPGLHPVVAHPPCRAWGRYAFCAKPALHERELAPFAVAQVRKWGGVLEHPANSGLWAHAGLPSPKGGVRDEWGGFTLHVDQLWWGHPCQKSTWLYVCGISPRDVPTFSAGFALPSRAIESNRRARRLGLPRLKALSHARRELTPPVFAEWLIELAGRCRPPVQAVAA